MTLHIVKFSILILILYDNTVKSQYLAIDEISMYICMCTIVIIQVIQACMHVYVCIKQLVFTVTVCYYCISDHGKITVYSQ